MVIVSFSVPSVSLPILFVGLDLRILLDVIVAFVIGIARAVTIGALSELAHALPAEVEAALVARHVIAIIVCFVRSRSAYLCYPNLEIVNNMMLITSLLHNSR